MRAASKQSLLSLGVVSALITVLVVLAVLQYRWSGEVSEAERQRLQGTLRTAMNQFREDLHRELASVCSAFEINPAGTVGAIENLYAEHYNRWGQNAPHPKLVAGLFLWENREIQASSFLHFNPKMGKFEAVACPSRFGDLCAGFEQRPAAPLSGLVPPRLPFAWDLRGDIPALVHPVFQAVPGGEGKQPPFAGPSGYVVIELNPSFLAKELLPELAQRYFGGPQGLEYQVAVVTSDNPEKVVYDSDPDASRQLLASADGKMPLFGPRHQRRFRPEGEGAPWQEPPLRVSPRPFLSEQGRDFPGRPRRFASSVIVPDFFAGNWQLVVRHRSGSLRDAVAALRRRNLALSFGVLLILATSIVLIIVWTQRVQTLARVRMGFVAGVSHELRTPVSVICSAAENLADGVVDAKSQVKRYGSLIRDEGRRLSEMVEQILFFAAAQERRRQYDLRPIQIAEVIDSALQESAGLIETSGFTVERQIERNLPPAVADPGAVSQCLRNLITNALKYGVSNRWLAIYAQAGAGAHGDEVQVTVQDRGPGIDPEDLPHVFEPFYRGNAAKASQVHGTGLGLSVVKELAEAMGIGLSVMSVPGRGSSFTLHLPIHKQADQVLV